MHIKNYFKYLSVVFLLSSFWSSNSLAGTFKSSTNLATAGSGRAAVVPADVNYLNPAALIHTTGAHFFASTGKDFYFVGLADSSRDVILPASFSYAQEKQFFLKTDKGELIRLTDNDRDKIESNDQAKVLIKDMSLAVADFLWGRASVGLTFRQYSAYFEGDRDYGVTSVDAGVLYPINENFGMGFTFTNVTQAQGTLPVSLKPPTKFGIAAHYIFKDFFRVRLDFESNENNVLPKSTAMLGIEDYLNQFFIVRMGFRNEPSQEKQYAAAGFGFESPRFGVNYGYQREVQGGNNTKHSVDLHVPF